MKTSIAQSAAIDSALHAPLTIVSAPPGAGKSWVIRSICDQLPTVRKLITARNIAICADMAIALGLPKDLKGGTDSLSVKNFDKITTSALGWKKYSGLGSPQRDSGGTLARSLGIDAIGDLSARTLSARTLSGLVEKTCQASWQAGDSVSLRYVPMIDVSADSENEADQKIEAIRSTVCDFAKMLETKIENESNSTRPSWPMVQVSTKFAFMKKMWVSLGAPISADLIMIDEAQDLDDAMIKAIEIWITSGKRVVLCGDAYQELYSWAGARNAMSHCAEKFNIQPIFLRESRRFGPTIASHASAVIQPLAGPDYVLGIADEPCEKPSSIDAFLFSTNAQVIGQALALGGVCQIPDSLRCEVRDIVADIHALSTGVRASGPLKYFPTIETLTKAIRDDERMADISKFIQIYESSDYATLMGIVETASNVGPVVSTFHRVKGQEWNSVEVTVPTRKVDPETKQPREWTRAERMAMYVAFTRAKSHLSIVGEY
jgi:AAA domain